MTYFAVLQLLLFTCKNRRLRISASSGNVRPSAFQNADWCQDSSTPTTFLISIFCSWNKTRIFVKAESQLSPQFSAVVLPYFLLQPGSHTWANYYYHSLPRLHTPKSHHFKKNVPKKVPNSRNVPVKQALYWASTKVFGVACYSTVFSAQSFPCVHRSKFQLEKRFWLLSLLQQACCSSRCLGSNSSERHTNLPMPVP